MKNITKGNVSQLRLVVMVIILGIVDLLSSFHRVSLGVIGQTVSADFGLTAVQFGLLGSVLFYSYASMQLPSGIMADKIPSRILLFFACGLTGLATIWFSVTNNFTGLLIARTVTGLSVAFIYVPVISTIRFWFGDKSLGLMTGIIVAMGQVGTVCASMPLKAFSDAVGWRSAFQIIGIATLVLSVLVYLVVIRRPSTPKDPNAPKVKINWKGAASGGFISITVWFFISGGTRFAFQGLWGTNYFTKVISMDTSTSSMMMFWMSIGCILGAFVLGWVSDRLGSIKTVLLSGLALAAVWIVLLFANANTPTWVFLSINVLLGIFGSGGFTVGFSCIRLFADKTNTGALTGIFNCGAFLGSAVFTQLVGVLMGNLKMDITGSFSVLFIVFAVLCIVSTGVVFILNRSRKQNFVLANNPVQES